ncbi:MAG: serine hydrolase [Candidatus Latescibacteria bacterium]|nr:serine hydrolase [Candidatus Latescibacterota bacterium]
MTDDIEQRLSPLVQAAAIPCVSLAVIEDSTVSWHGTFSNATGPVVPGEPVFEGASLGKPVLAYLVLKLCESGSLGLDTPLSVYFPELFTWQQKHERCEGLAIGQERRRVLTVRHLLSHTTNGPFAYHGGNYACLQRILERVTGEPLARYAKDHLFAPLGMARSSYTWEESFEDGAVQGHWESGGPVPKAKLEQAEAEWSLHTTALDYARFLVEMLKPPLESRHSLTPAMVATMLSPQVRLDQSLSWGLGWGLEQTAAARAFWHWGDNDGYDAFAWASSDSTSGLVVLANIDGAIRTFADMLRLTMGGEHPSVAWAYDFWRRWR